MAQRSDTERIKSRLLANIEIDDTTGCWVWKGPFGRRGYGKIRVNGRISGTHRVSAHAYNGFDLQCEKQVLHRCDNPPCVNPDHLFIGTCADNMADRDAKGRHRPSLGEKHGRSKLTDLSVREIRRLGALKLPHAQIAAKFGVSRPAVSLILEGKTWAHLPIDPEDVQRPVSVR